MKLLEILLILCTVVYGQPSGIFSSILNVVNTFDHEPIVILPVSALGLANRIRIISGIKEVSAQSNAKLIVLWFKSFECNATFEELISISAQFHVISFESEIEDERLFNFLVNTTTTIANMTQKSARVIMPTQFFVDEFFQNKHFDITVIWTRGLHGITSTIDCVARMRDNGLFYSSILPSYAVQGLIDTMHLFLAATENKIGIHIRVFDNRNDWEMVVPSCSVESVCKAETFGNGDEQIALFVELMSVILQHHPSTIFFIASNSLAVKEKMMRHFKSGNIVSLLLEETGDRESVAGVQLAMAEFLLLGSCSLIIHSRGSSFAQGAAMARMVPIVDVFSIATAPVLSASTPPALFALLTHHSALFTCGVEVWQRGNPLFCKKSQLVGIASAATTEQQEHALSAPTSFCYDEPGTRMMCTVLIWYCPCSRLSSASGIYSTSIDSSLYWWPSLSPMLLCAVGVVTKDKVLPVDCVMLPAESNGYSL